VQILYFADIRFPIERANGIQTVHTCDALARRGHTVVLVVRPDVARPVRDPFDFYGLSPNPRLVIRTVAVPRGSGARRVAYLGHALVRTVADRRPTQVVLTRDLGLASLALSLPRVLRPPLVYESHGFAPAVSEAMPDLLSGGRPSSAAKRRRLNRRERRVWKRANGYVTITAALAQELEGRFGPRERVATIPDGVRLQPGRRFEPPRVGESPLIAYAGHLYPWKGVDVLLQALALLKSARGLIVGGHPGEPDLQAARSRADEIGVGGRVQFVETVEPWRVPGFLEQADILVLPNTATVLSARYTSPLKLFEYMAAGKPIVASNLPAIREILRDGENAVLTEPGSPEALAAAIGRLAGNPVLTERIARAAFHEANEYGWDRRAERLERVFETVIAAEAGMDPLPASRPGGDAR
jgi:glycosyltransferase involved in cell wall biosynthesis